MQFDSSRRRSCEFSKKEIRTVFLSRIHRSITALPVSKIIMQMKLISFFLLAVCIQASASVSAQKITLTERKASLQKVLREIRRQSDFDFIVNARFFKDAQPLSISVKEMPIEEVLPLVFANQPVDYMIDNKTIIIRDRVTNTGADADPAQHDQQEQVTGTVTNSKNEPLANVSIIEKGTKNGVVSNENGRFSITVKDKNAILEITYVGYRSSEVRVSSGNFNIILEAEDGNLQDVVVVGYGQQRKRDLTGSISQVRGAELTQLPVQRVDQALQGRAAGVLVLNTDGAPGGNTTIRVRGMNSINGGNNALIVIDGLQGGNLNSLNPNDIESIEILKDASATAIYGSQGANGVILITTKNGKKGKPIVDYNFSIGTQKIRHKLDVMGAADYARTVNAYRETQNLSGPPVLVFTDSQIAEFEKNGGTDWQDEIYRTGTIQNHQLSVGGGSDNTKYMISGGYLDQQGILINSGYLPSIFIVNSTSFGGRHLLSLQTI